MDKPVVIGGAIALFFAGAVAVAIYIWNSRKNTPSVQGFYGGAAKVSPTVPNCMTTSSEAQALAGLFTGRASTVGPTDDLNEFLVLLSKLACFKKDLMSPSGIVEATRYQDFRTSHDIEPVAETVSKCLSKNIPPRDLEIVLEKWQKRGGDLLRRLCTTYDLEQKEIEGAEKRWAALLRDVTDVARKICLTGTPMIAGKEGPREAHPMTPENVTELGPYDGYY